MGWRRRWGRVWERCARLKEGGWVNGGCEWGKGGVYLRTKPYVEGLRKEMEGRRGGGVEVGAVCCRQRANARQSRCADLIRSRL